MLAMLVSLALAAAPVGADRPADPPSPTDSRSDVPPRATAAPTLDGKTFQVRVVDPQGKEDTDTLLFRDGTFRSTACDRYGFTAAPYTVEVRPDGAMAFKSDSRSPSEGRNQWEGRVLGDRVEGSFTWTKEGQAPVKYTFDGRAVTTRQRGS